MNISQAYPSCNVDMDHLPGALKALVYKPDGPVFSYFHKFARYIVNHLNTTCKDVSVPFDSDVLVSIKALGVPEVTVESISTYLAKVVKILRMSEGYDKTKVTMYLRHVLPAHKYSWVADKAAEGTPNHFFKQTMAVLFLIGM